MLARRRLLSEQAATDGQLDALESDARNTVEQAVERARSAPAPQLEEAYAHVFSD
jgi:TPP-dependent pyruvate/acetoin dehydrogenase alpha subunit